MAKHRAVKEKKELDAVRKGVGTDTRIGKRFLFAGIGYGGSCFPKDVQALAKSAQAVDYDFKILKSVMTVNEDQKTKLVPRMLDYFNGELKGKKIALWGLAFKPYTDDIREAPALYNIDKLLEAGAQIRAYDPEAMENVRGLVGDKIEFADDAYDAVDGADALMIATEWPVFRTPDFEEVGHRIKEKVIFDGRNLYSLDEMNDLGFKYFSIGRATVNG
jgi:UDPglucose 6-dehydrogenase